MLTRSARSLQTCWRSAAEVYLRVLAMNQGGPTDLVQQQIAQQQIDTIVEAMKRLGVVFPIASTYALYPPLPSPPLHSASRSCQR